MSSVVSLRLVKSGKSNSFESLHLGKEKKCCISVETSCFNILEQVLIIHFYVSLRSHM